MVIDPLCSICNLEIETTYHILWGCPSASDVWGVSSRGFQKSIFPGPDFINVAEGMHKKFDGDEFCLFAEIAWRIWFRRNTWIHEGIFLHPDAIVSEANTAVQEFQRINKADGGLAQFGWIVIGGGKNQGKDGLSLTVMPLLIKRTTLWDLA